MSEQKLTSTEMKNALAERGIHFGHLFQRWEAIRGARDGNPSYTIHVEDYVRESEADTEAALERLVARVYAIEVEGLVEIPVDHVAVPKEPEHPEQVFLVKFAAMQCIYTAEEPSEAFANAENFLEEAKKRSLDAVDLLRGRF